MISLIPTVLVNTINFETYKIDSRLLPWIQSVWSFNNTKNAVVSREKFYPDGGVSLSIHFSNPEPFITVEFNRTAIYREIDSSTAVISIRFQPGGFTLLWSPQVLVEASQPLVLGTDVTPYWYPSLRNLVELMTADDLSQCATMLQHWLLEQSAASRFGCSHGVKLARAIQVGHSSIDDMINEFGMTRRTIERRLKSEVGFSPKEMVAIRRMQHARKWLCGTEASIADIAVECGFFDQAHFSHAFKKYALETPAAYRKRKLSHFYND